MRSVRERMLAGPPLQVAHRGASLLCPENTMPAFQMAAQQRAAMIEMDVQLTRDKQVIVMHDARLDRTTNGFGCVADVTWSEMAHLDAGSWKHVAFQDTPIPRLADVLHWLPANMYLNIEVKGSPQTTVDLVRAVVTLVNQSNLQSKVLLSSFNHEALAMIRDMDAAIALGAIYYGRLWPRFHLARSLGLTSLHPHVSELDANYVRDIQTNGLGVMAWTLTQPEEVAACKAWNVNALVANDITLLR